MNRGKLSQSPNQANTNKRRAKLRLSSLETFQRIYDNKTYNNQLTKLLDPLMAATLSKKYTPSTSYITKTALTYIEKYRDLLTTFTTYFPIARASVTGAGKFPLKQLHELLGSRKSGPSFLQDTPSNLTQLVTRTNLSSAQHKRATSFHAHSDFPPRNNSRSASRKQRKSPGGFLRGNDLDILTDSFVREHSKRLSFLFINLIL